MRDQVKSFGSKGLRAAYVSEETQTNYDIAHEVVDGQFQVFFLPGDVTFKEVEEGAAV